MLAGILIALPNALPNRRRRRPCRAGCRRSSVSLGLDLQGGSYLLLEVELDKVQKDRLVTLVSDIRAGLRKARIGYTDLQTTGDQASVRILDTDRFDEAKKILADLNPAVGGSVLSVGAHEYTLTAPGNGKLVMKMTDAYIRQTRTDIVNQSIEVVRRRIDAMGTKEPTIETAGRGPHSGAGAGPRRPDPHEGHSGQDREDDLPAGGRDCVDPAGPQGHRADRRPSCSISQRGRRAQPDEPIVVQKRVMVAGDRLTDARAGIDQQTGEPEVDFRFDSVGSREFGNVTKENVGRRFAIVLDNKVISAPVIQTPILGGSGQHHRQFHGSDGQ